MNLLKAFVVDDEFNARDKVSLDSTHRMNVPGSGSENCNWRVKAELMTTDIGDQLRNLSLHTGRSW